MSAAKKQVVTGVVALVTGLSAPAFAVDGGGYVLGSAGVTNFSGIEPSVSGADSKTTSSTGLRIGGGYLFGDGPGFKFGVEGGYVDLGKAEYKFSNPTETDALKASGLYVAALGVFPIDNQWAILAKVGLFSSTVKWEISCTCGNASGNSTGINIMYGIGGQYDINRQLGIRAEYEVYPSGKKPSSTSFDVYGEVSLFSASIVYKF